MSNNNKRKVAVTLGFGNNSKQLHVSIIWEGITLLYRLEFTTEPSDVIPDPLSHIFSLSISISQFEAFIAKLAKVSDAAWRPRKTSRLDVFSCLSVVLQRCSWRSLALCFPTGPRCWSRRSAIRYSTSAPQVGGRSGRSGTCGTSICLRSLLRMCQEMYWVVLICVCMCFGVCTLVNNVIGEWWGGREVVWMKI